MVYSFTGIAQSAKDILLEQTNQLKLELAEPALLAIQAAKKNLHTSYVNQLMSDSVMNQMATRAAQTKELDEMYQRVKELKKIALEYHEQNLRFHKKSMYNEAIVKKDEEQLKEYHTALDEYNQRLNEREKVFGITQDRDMLQQPMIQAVMAIEQARDVFQKPILYKVGLYSESSSDIVYELEMTFEQLVENNLVSVKAQNSDNLLNTLSLSMSINKNQIPSLLGKLQVQQRLSKLGGVDAQYILTGEIGTEKYDTQVNRGWRYQYYLEGRAGRTDNKQDNKSWAAGPDVYSSGRYNYQAKFLAEGNTVKISSLVSLFGSLEAYEYKLRYILGRPIGSMGLQKMDIDNQVQQFEQNIIDSLINKGLNVDLIYNL